ncbi:unnamed protein product [Prorocentrum cordatum]|uniref:Anaphase-promoting complex subunit 1 n=1 Tax=Prorocentrum cordatum TaxID=2364126 RepID=A0ABN9R572_9DINO|nr:unnamed protein product [Polarella glacialis]
MLYRILIVDTTWAHMDIMCTVPLVDDDPVTNRGRAGHIVCSPRALKSTTIIMGLRGPVSRVAASIDLLAVPPTGACFSDLVRGDGPARYVLRWRRIAAGRPALEKAEPVVADQVLAILVFLRHGHMESRVLHMSMQRPGENGGGGKHFSSCLPVSALLVSGSSTVQQLHLQSGYSSGPPVRRSRFAAVAADAPPALISRGRLQRH